MADRDKPMAWLPFSIAEASMSGGPDEDQLDLPQAWSYLTERLTSSAAIVESDPVSRNRIDLAAGMRHLLVLLAAGIDTALRVDPDPILGVQSHQHRRHHHLGDGVPGRLVHRIGAARRRELPAVRQPRHRPLRRTADDERHRLRRRNALVDELEVDADGNFEVILSADERSGNWMRIEGEHPTLTVRHFFYDWDTEVPSSLQIERIGGSAHAKDRSVDRDVAVSRQLVALGDFVHDNLKFFLDFGEAPPVNGFLPGIDRSAMGAAAENRPVIGRWALDPDEALILEVEPPEGVYWSYSLGNPWWETIHYGRHQSSLNAQQAARGFRWAGAGRAQRS